MLQKVIGWLDNFAVEERQASKLGCGLTILAYVAAAAYLAYVISTWLADPVTTTVSFDFSDTAPSQVTLLCKSECGCAFQSKFSTACVGATASGKIAFNAKQTLSICPGAAWDDGIFVTGSIRAIGLSVVWFVPNTAQPDSVAPLPATNLLDRQASKLVHLRETRLTTYEAPDTSTSAFQIGYVGDGPQCPTAPPTAACDLAGLLNAANSADLSAFDPAAVSASDSKAPQTHCARVTCCRSTRCAPTRTRSSPTRPPPRSASMAARSTLHCSLAACCSV